MRPLKKRAGKARIKTWIVYSILITLFFSLREADAKTVAANPTNYTSQLETLQPGDTLVLEAGRYVRLTLDGLNGTPDAWITVTGPTSGPPAIIEAESSCCNTVQIYRSSYLAIKNLTIDGKSAGADGINAKDSISHHILIENNTLMALTSGDQQTVGISTKSAAWGWIIRNNKIFDAGTGLYLGSSDGSAPFIGGIIEGNLIKNPVGYGMQIKWQKPYTLSAGMPSGPNKTIIRDNVFIKDNRPSPDGDRPNLLVGGFPTSGPGTNDHYEIYGNFFYNNPRENLLQASGRVMIHDNIFVGASNTSIYLANHDLPLKLAYVYNNTIYGGSRGIHFANAAAEGSAVIGNLIFTTGTGVSGSVTNQKDNLADTVQNAGQYVKSPSTTLGSMDFYPLPGKSQGTPIDLKLFSTNVDYNLDFNRTSKGDGRFRGAYAGEGTNPGWGLTDGLKSVGSRPAGDGIPPAAPRGLRIVN